MSSTPPPSSSSPIPAHAVSEYMQWAKTRQAARFNLGNSGLGAMTLAELGARLEDIELSGPSFYGWPPLLEALSRHLEVTVNRVCHAEGTSLANYLAMAVTLEPGDEVLVESPSYELLVDTARYLRAVVKRFPRPRSLGFQPDLAALRAALTPRTRLIVVTNLHNPSSVRIPDTTLLALADLAAEVNARVLVDEVYLDAAFDPALRTAHRLSDRILTTSSLTKVYGLSGLRCGWVVAEPTLVERMWRLNDLLGVIPAHSAERLSLVALRELPRLRARSASLLNANRDLWNQFLAGRRELESDPLQYGTVAFPRLVLGSVDALCERLRVPHETTVTPGAFFGEPSAIRVGLGSSTEIFAEGLRRLGLALDEVVPRSA